MARRKPPPRAEETEGGAKALGAAETVGMEVAMETAEVGVGVEEQMAVTAEVADASCRRGDRSEGRSRR